MGNETVSPHRKKIHVRLFRENSSTRQTQVKQRQDPIDPLQIIIRTNSAGKRQKRPSQCGFILAVIEIVYRIPGQQMVGEPVQMNDQTCSKSG